MAEPRVAPRGDGPSLKILVRTCTAERSAKALRLDLGQPMPITVVTTSSELLESPPATESGPRIDDISIAFTPRRVVAMECTCCQLA
jgi:hypothetical protein